jgi:lysozyme
METSKEMRERMKQWEGLKLTAYKCPAGVWTIGYGHTGSDVKQGQTITAARANELFNSDLLKFETKVKALLTASHVTLKQNQYDALVSFAYNAGVGNLTSSTLWRMVKADPNDAGIEAQFNRWVYASGKVLPGLVTRRKAEGAIYAGKLKA